MGYLHIDNLYKSQHILEYKHCYSLEKIHGTSAHIKHENGELTFFSGGEKHEKFLALFDVDKLKALFDTEFGEHKVPIIFYGEAYGGKQQGMSQTYGPNLKFIVFDVKINEHWLTVPDAADLAEKFGLEFVDYVKIPCDIELINAERDKPSTQALRNGIAELKLREGVVLRPLFEVTLNNGSRVISKHKRAEFSERGTPKLEDLDPTKRVILDTADAIAQEWVTSYRLTHVVDQLVRDREIKIPEMQDVPVIIRLMMADITRESAGEVDSTVLTSKPGMKAIGARTVQMFKRHVNELLENRANETRVMVEDKEGLPV